MTSKIDDHAGEALARLPQQFADKPNVEKMINALAVPAQALEAALWQLLTERTIDTAVGTQLDELGAIVGEDRSGRDDTTYRRYIRARVLANKSQGLNSDIIKVGNAVLDDLTATIGIEHQPPAALQVEVQGLSISEELANILIEFLLGTKLAGVRLLLAYFSTPIAELYRYDTATPGLGLNDGKWSGVKESVGVQPEVAELLLDGVFALPAIQHSPVTLAEFQEFYPDVLDPDHLYDFDQSSTTIADRIASEDLTITGANYVNEQPAVGLVGALFAWQHVAWETTVNNDATTYAQPAGAALLDAGATGSIGFFLRFRYRGNYPSVGSAHPLIKKNAGGRGWEVVAGNNLQVEVQADDPYDVVIPGNFNDGAWHSLLVVIDKDASAFYVYTDKGSGSVTIDDVGSTSNASKLQLGGASTLIIPRNGGQMQIEHLCLWTSGAEVLTQTAFDLLHTHAVAPSQFDVADHAGTLVDLIGVDSSEGLRVAEYGADQWPVFHRAPSGEPAFFGLAHRIDQDSGFDQLNNNRHSHVFTDWPLANMTVSGAVADLVNSPRGFREAWKLTATATPGLTGYTYTTVAATEYTQSILVRSDSGTVAGKLKLWDGTGGALVAEVAFVATTAWQLVTITATTNAGQISTDFLIQIDTNTEVLHVWGMTPVLGATWAIIPSIRYGTLSTQGDEEATDYQINDVAGALIKNSEGLIRTSVHFDEGNPSADQYLLDAFTNGGGNNARTRLLMSPTGDVECDVYDGAGTLQHALAGGPGASSRQVIEARWAADDSLESSKGGELSVGETIYDQLDGTYTADDLADRIWLGQDKAGINKLRAIMYWVEVWDKAQQLAVSGPVAVFWTADIGVTVDGNTLKDPTLAGWANGAVSEQYIPDGKNGYVEFGVESALTHKACGLSVGNTDEYIDDIDFNIYVKNDGSILIEENLIVKYTSATGAYAADSLFRVSRVGTDVEYWHRDAGTWVQLPYTSTGSTGDLLVDTSLYGTGTPATQIKNVIISGAVL